MENEQVQYSIKVYYTLIGTQISHAGIGQGQMAEWKQSGEHVVRSKTSIFASFVPADTVP